MRPRRTPDSTPRIAFAMQAQQLKMARDAQSSLWLTTFAARNRVDTLEIEANSPARLTSFGQHRGIIYWMIAGFKLAKGVLLLAVGVGALTLVGKDVADQAAHLVEVLNVDPDNTYVHALMVKLTRIDDRTLAQISAGTFFYSGLLLTEGIGLFLRKRWAEYFTIVVTGSFIPLEAYGLIKSFSAAKIAILFVNVGVVVYLAVRVLRVNDHKEED